MTTKHEVSVTLVDFFDFTVGTAGAIKHFWWDTEQNLFNNNVSGVQGQDLVFSRVRSCTVHVLPRRGIDTEPALVAFNNAVAMYTVSVQTPGVSVTGSSTAQDALATNVQTTNVLPQFDTKWKQVFHCNLQKTFESGVIRPFMDTTRQCLFSLQILDPTTGTVIGGVGNDDVNIRVKVTLQIDNPIAPIQKAKFGILSNNDAATPQTDAAGSPLPALTPTYCQMDVRRVIDMMR